jgi:hypothetical protein
VRGAYECNNEPSGSIKWGVSLLAGVMLACQERLSSMDLASRCSQIPRHSAHVSDKVVSPVHRLSLSPGKYFSYSFLIEVESIPEPYCGRKEYINEKFQ